LSQRGSLNVLISPSIKESERLIDEAISQRRTLFLAGRCRVHYVGRAESKLEPGERIVIIKADGSLLVHRSVGYEPVNWMPGGEIVLNARSTDETLEVRALRRKPVESVRILFDQMQLVASLSLDDSGEFSLYASEQDMRKAILVRPDLLEEGFKPITYEKKVEPGFVDVYGEDKDGNLVVVEIKRKTASKEAAVQLSRYIEAVRARSSRLVRGVLAAPGVGKDVQRTLMTLGLEYRYLDPKKCTEALARTEGRKLFDFFRKT